MKLPRSTFNGVTDPLIDDAPQFRRTATCAVCRAVHSIATDCPKCRDRAIERRSREVGKRLRAADALRQRGADGGCASAVKRGASVSPEKRVAMLRGRRFRLERERRELRDRLAEVERQIAATDGELGEASA